MSPSNVSSPVAQGRFPGASFLKCSVMLQLAPKTNHHCVHVLFKGSLTQPLFFQSKRTSAPLKREPLPSKHSTQHPVLTLVLPHCMRFSPSQTLSTLLEQPSTTLLVRERMVLVCAAVVAMTGGDAVNTFISRAVALASAPAIQSQVSLCQRQLAVCYNLSKSVT